MDVSASIRETHCHLPAPFKTAVGFPVPARCKKQERHFPSSTTPCITATPVTALGEALKHMAALQGDPRK